MKKYFAAQAVASIVMNLESSGLVEVSETEGNIQAVPDVQVGSTGTTRGRTIQIVSKTQLATEPAAKTSLAAPVSVPSESDPATTTPPPSWCPPPSVYAPVPPRPGSPNSPSGLCVTEKPVRNGKTTIKYCSLIGGYVMCYVVKIDCSVANQSCKFTVTTPWGDIPSMFLPPVTCENPPAQPYDPSGVYRVKCTLDPSIHPVPLEICYKINPDTRGIVPIDCPTPPVTPITPTPVQPTTPPNRDDAHPPVVY